ncbi:MAG: quinone-dependent dihydroorotate dehydrogenase [Pyrinomonadaceae bacterium]
MGFIWRNIGRPLLFGLDAERAHDIGIHALKAGLGAPSYSRADTFGFEPIEKFGLQFPNPVGVAAGFDKNGVVFDQLASLGFGFVEVGTVTLRPQKGNEKPRLFRLPEDKALINRLGFNNEGAAKAASRLSLRKRKNIVGLNIGKNKDVPNEEAIPNYLACLDLVHPVADYVAVNVSSPNTPGLRELQKGENLEDLLSAISSRNTELGAKPLLVKIAPDLTESEIESIVSIVMKLELSGIIATNTTISREGLKTKDADSFGSGGLSGRPLKERSNEVISKIFRSSDGRLPIIGVGGIFTGEDAFEKIAAGASLVQAYTGFIYRGPTFPLELNQELANILKAKGFSTVEEAVGTAVL